MLAVLKAVRHADEARSEGTVLCVAFVLATCGHGCDCGTVVVAVAVKDLVLLAAVFFVGDLADQFKGLLVRLRAGVCVIDAVHAGHLRDQFFREQCAGDRADCAAEKVHLNNGVAHCIAHCFAAVAYVYCPNATSNRIKVFDAFLVPDTHAFAFDDDLWVSTGDKLLMLAEVMPNICAIRFDDAG